MSYRTGVQKDRRSHRLAPEFSSLPLLARCHCRATGAVAGQFLPTTRWIVKATDAIEISRQTAQPPGQPALVVTEVVCPHCRRPVKAPSLTVNGELMRAHKYRLPDGSLCPYGLTERDPAGTIVAF